MPKKRDAETKKLIAEITVDCHDEDEQLMAFGYAINDAIDSYAKAFHLDEPVYLVEANFNKGLRAGPRAKITRQSKNLKRRCWIWRLIRRKKKKSFIEWSRRTNIF